MCKLVELKNLFFAYEKEDVLKDVNLSIYKGDFFAFIGPNGTGKSTLMKLMIGNLLPDSGVIRLLGKEIGDFKDWPKIAYISQQVRGFNQSFPATVKEIVAANLYQEMGFIKILNKALEEKIDQALRLVGMSDFKNRQIGNLSGGQQQRVFIARTLVTDPLLIFLDEPLVGIDNNSQNKFIKIITKLNKELNITFVIVSHNFNLIRNHVNKIAAFDLKSNVSVCDSKDFDYELYLDRINSKGKIAVKQQAYNGGDYNA